MHYLLQLLRSLAPGANLGLPNKPRGVPLWNDGYVSYYDLCPAIFPNFRRLP